MATTESTDTVAVRLPKSTIAQLDSLAASAGRTRSNFLARIISQSVDARALTKKKNYPIEKFYLAVLSLATGADEIHERLYCAAITLVVLSAERDVPEDLRERFAGVWDALTREQAQIEGEGRLRATIRQMKPEDASQIAEQILDLYFRLLDITPLGNRRE